MTQATRIVLRLSRCGILFATPASGLTAPPDADRRSWRRRAAVAWRATVGAVPTRSGPAAAVTACPRRTSSRRAVRALLDLQHLAQRTRGQPGPCRVQDDGAERLARAQLREVVVGGGAQHREEAAVGESGVALDRAGRERPVRARGPRCPAAGSPPERRRRKRCDRTRGRSPCGSQELRRAGAAAAVTACSIRARAPAAVIT